MTRVPSTVLAGVTVFLLVGAAELRAQAYLVKDIKPGSADGTDLFEQAHAADGALAVDDTLFFAADDGLHCNELWKTDGTEAGTVLVSDVNPGPNGSFPRELTRVGNVVFFSAEDAVHGRELWKSDGTAAGTVLMKDIIPGTPSSLELPYPAVSTLTAPAVMGNSLFFVAQDGVHGATLWKSDGTEAGTVLVKVVGPSANIRYLLPLAGVLYFSSNTDQSTLGNGGLWKSDGTEAGTTLVRAFPQDQPFYLTSFGGLVYFGMASDMPMGGLWKSDGTTDGTVLVWANSSMSSGGTAPLQVANGRLFFSANNEPYVSDGTTAGTKLLKDINPTANASVGSATTFVGLSGSTFFAADDQIHGSELWKTDGTEAGTVLVKDIHPGQGMGMLGLSAKTLTCASGALYFLAKDQPDNFELWKSDGTQGGTVLFQDFNPQTGSWATPVAQAGNLLYVEADDGTSGRELWALDVGDPSPVVSFAAARGMAAETARTRRIAVRVTTPCGTPTTTPVSVDYTTTSETATEGEDYISASGTLSLAAGSASGSILSIPVTILGDGLVEGNETFTVRLSGPKGGRLRRPARHSVTIVDDDALPNLQGRR